MVEVLSRTGGFAIDALLPRLVETFQWLLQCTMSLSSIRPTGKGHTSTIRVRLLRARVRRQLVSLAQSRPNYFDLATYGVPVNDLDALHSISTFCANPLWQWLPRQGIWPSEQEQEDYVALFRYLGHVIGAPQQHFDSARRAKAVMESLLYHGLRPTETSGIMAHNFLECLTDTGPLGLSRPYLDAMWRWMSGQALCDELGLPRPGLLHYGLVISQCALVAGLCRVQRWCPSVDQWVILVRVRSPWPWSVTLIRLRHRVSTSRRGWRTFCRVNPTFTSSLCPPMASTS